MRKLMKCIAAILFLSSIVSFGQYSSIIHNAKLIGGITGTSSSKIKVDSISVANLIATEKVILDIAAGKLVLQDGTFLIFTDGTEADSVTMVHDGTDFVITGDGATTALELEGLDLELKNGALIQNSTTDLLTITEATVAVAGKIMATKVTEQMRLGYDGTNYATWTVAADGALTLVTVDATAAEGDINFNPDGLVGIKTAVPTVELDVTGAGKFSADLTVTGGDVIGANGNAIDIGEATDGTITFSRDDAGVVTLTNVDNNADADLTVSAGGTGALTLGDVGSTTAISSSDWTISTTGLASLSQLSVMRARDDDTHGTEEVAYIAGYLSGQDSVGGGSAKTYCLTIEGSRLSGTPTLIGDIDDAGLKMRLTNYGTTNAAGYTLRGLDISVKNSSASGFATNLNGGSIALQTESGSTTTNTIGLSVANNLDGTVTDLSLPLDVRSFRQSAGVPTTEAIARFRNGNTTGTGIATGILITSEAGDPARIVNGIDMDDAVITGANIVTSSGAKIFTGTAANGDAVYAEVGAYDATGSIYLSTAAGAIYVQVANAGAATDWFKVQSADDD